MSEIKIPDVSPAEAWQMLKQSRAVLLDVRTTMEYQYVGHPVGAVHVPWKEAPDWQTDPQFVAKVKQALTGCNDEEPVEDLPVLTICRSGKRSLAAAEALAQQGFSEVYNIAEGFEGDLDENNHRNTKNGWRFHDLPWEQT